MFYLSLYPLFCFFFFDKSYALVVPETCPLHCPDSQCVPGTSEWTSFLNVIIILGQSPFFHVERCPNPLQPRDRKTNSGSSDLVACCTAASRMGQSPSAKGPSILPSIIDVECAGCCWDTATLLALLYNPHHHCGLPPRLSSQQTSLACLSLLSPCRLLRPLHPPPLLEILVTSMPTMTMTFSSRPLRGVRASLHAEDPREGGHAHVHVEDSVQSPTPPLLSSCTDWL